MANNRISIEIDGQQAPTLRDILPGNPGLRILFIGKTPAPKSVEAGHYFQGAQGKAFWKALRTYRILEPTTPFEDDSLLANGFGLTDIAKVPRVFGNEPSEEEYRSGSARILELIRLHKPCVAVFVYKRVLDQMLRIAFGLSAKSAYGFNPAYDELFSARVFAFPLPGVGGCSRSMGHSAMRGLAEALR